MMRTALALLLVAIASVSASAQTWEMSGFAAFTPEAGLDRHSESLDDLHLRGGFTFGVQATRFFTPHWGAEVVFTQQRSGLEADIGDDAAEFYRISIAQVHANVVYQFGSDTARLRPFVFGGAGATFFDARDLDSASKASFGVGGGLKYFPWPTVGFRGQFRYKPVWLNDDPESDFCAPFGFCQSWIMPAELAAGVIIRF
jgi:outer membrane protein W